MSNLFWLYPSQLSRLIKSFIISISQPKLGISDIRIMSISTGKMSSMLFSSEYWNSYITYQHGRKILSSWCWCTLVRSAWSSISETLCGEVSRATQTPCRKESLFSALVHYYVRQKFLLGQRLFERLRGLLYEPKLSTETDVLENFFDCLSVQEDCLFRSKLLVFGFGVFFVDRVDDGYQLLAYVLLHWHPAVRHYFFHLFPPSIELFEQTLDNPVDYLAALQLLYWIVWIGWGSKGNVFSMSSYFL